MNVQQILTSLQQGLALVEAFAPIAAMTGPAGAEAAAVVEQLGQYADAVLQAAQEANDVLSSDDIAKIEAATSSLKAANAALALQIADS